MMAQLLAPRVRRANVPARERPDAPSAAVVATLRCDGCGCIVARVRDTRFGLPPSGSLCVACTHPAWARAPSL